MKDGLEEWFLKMDIIRKEGISGHWLRELLSGHVPTDSIPAHPTLNDFFGLISQSATQNSVLSALKAATEPDLAAYEALQAKVEAGKQAARQARVALEVRLQQAEDALYRSHFTVVAKKQREKLLAKAKKRPLYDRVKTRRALLEAEMTANGVR